MQHITMIGLDVAKHVFQLHGIDHEGRAVLRKKLTTSLRTQKAWESYT